MSRVLIGIVLVLGLLATQAQAQMVHVTKFQEYAPFIGESGAIVTDIWMWTPGVAPNTELKIQLYKIPAPTEGNPAPQPVLVQEWPNEAQPAPIKTPGLQFMDLYVTGLGAFEFSKAPHYFVQVWTAAGDYVGGEAIY